MLSSSKKYPIYLLWPNRVVLEDKIPFFLPEGKYVFYTDSKITCSDIDYIQICKNTENNEDLTDRKIFIKYLPIRLSEDFESSLLKMDNDLFWRYVKYLIVLNKEYKSLDLKKDKMYLLFDNISKGFSKVFPIYKSIDISDDNIIFYLTTMFSYCLLDDSLLCDKFTNSWFRSLIINNRKNLNRFKKCLSVYLLSEKTKSDFMFFLYSMCPF